MIIERQIIDGIAAVGAAGFMNNFAEFLPDGSARRGDTIIGSAYAAQLDALMPEPEGERAKQVSLREFFADVDRAFSDAVSLEEVDPNEIAALREAGQREQLSLRALPVYRRLRLRGYGHYDLFR